MEKIKNAIESLHTAEQTPRLHVDATHEAVVCPDFLRERFGEQLIIDLDPSWPLDLAFTEVGVEADLSFGGYVSRCVFPWDAIYVVADRSTGRGMIIEGNMPTSVRGKFAGATKPKPKPKLEIEPKIDEGDGDEDLSKIKRPAGKRRPKRRKRKRKPGLVAAPEAEANEETGEIEDEAETEAEAAETPDEDEVKSRRAAFRVIEGGD